MHSHSALHINKDTLVKAGVITISMIEVQRGTFRSDAGAACLAAYVNPSAVPTAAPVA